MLLNLSDVLAVTDPAAAAEAARTAAGHLRRTGDPYSLTGAIGNLVQALLLLGDWDGADHELTQAIDSEGLSDFVLVTYRGWLAALRGDADAAEIMRAGMRASDELQDKALVSVAEAFTAAARRLPQDTLRHARNVLAHAGALGIGHELLRWAWPLAARAAHELRDAHASGELLALLDSCPPGHLAPMQKAERELARTRLAENNGDQAAAAGFTAAVNSLREYSTPYHLAHGLLDHAQHLIRAGEAEDAAGAIGEARTIAHELGCQPLLDRADAMVPAKTRA